MRLAFRARGGLGILAMVTTRDFDRDQEEGATGHVGHGPTPML